MAGAVELCKLAVGQVRMPATCRLSKILVRPLLSSLSGSKAEPSSICLRISLQQSHPAFKTTSGQG